MRLRTLFALVLLAGCPGAAGIGDHCGDRGDCASSLQCVDSTCVPKCQRAPDCGDGYSCDKDGICHAATGQLGDSCSSEVDCAAGLACELEGTATDPQGHLAASCVMQNAGRPAGDLCVHDGDCRNGTCALGHCIDLCADTRDCGEGTACALIPRVEATGAMFAGCLQAHGSLVFPLPVHGPSDFVALPIPDSARSVAVTFSVEDPSQAVGATRVTAPDGTTVVTQQGYGDPVHWSDPVRHQLALGQSVLAMPSSPEAPLLPGVYEMSVASQTVTQTAGSATPSAIAVLKLDSTVNSSVILDLHFYFLNFDEHPCLESFGGQLDAATARSKAFFQTDYLGQLRSVFAHAGVALGTSTYEDLRNHPDLDGLNAANAGSLFSLGAHAVGINVFFVRTLSPVGLQALGPAPGPAGLAGTRGSGIVIGADTLCYRSWPDVARLTAHELARYMGLYDNVEIDDSDASPRRDPIRDSDISSSNLMYFSELGGTDLSPGQRDILTRSPVLR
ncbi:MAG: hypothetical protein JO257_23340 [Deltaproteobacteria bacterium]|nr:hypothetical protein [Deltaproteobacteria bacterium]